MKKRSKPIWWIIAITVIVAVPVFITDHARSSCPVTGLVRNGYEEGDRTMTLTAVTDDGYKDDIEVNVREKGYTKKEIEDMSQKLDKIIWTDILGRNTDPENVMYDLDLKDHIEGYPFKIIWKSDRPLILKESGVIDTVRLAKEDPNDEGVNVRLCATIRYREYIQDLYSYVIVRHAKSSYEETMKEAIEGSVKEADETSVDKDMQKLPKSAGGHRIWFYEKQINRGWAVLFTGIMLAVLLKSAKENRAREEAIKRKKQMDIDHPKILNQYMLYYLAGMNPRTIWFAICKMYEENLDHSGKNRRYAYDEMVNTRNRMEEGCSELAAYDEFARKVDNIRYRSFISLVKQSVVKGNSGLSDLLYEEIDKALKERNNMIKTQGSEAETKMLLPMFMMLITVLVFVMVPALIGLNG